MITGDCEEYQMSEASVDGPLKAEPPAICIPQGILIVNVMSAGWTDERHTLYISSMEASFIDQLCSYKVNQKDSSAHDFEIIRGGVWGKLKSQRTNVCAPVTGECLLPANPWMPDCSSSARSHVAETAVGDHESGIWTIRGRSPLSHERELGACNGENLLDDNTEVSDQNFSDYEAEVNAESSKSCKKRWLSSTSTY